jgi:hypothetical protein
VIALAGILVIAALGAIAVGGNGKPNQIAQPSPNPASPAAVAPSPSEAADPSTAPSESAESAESAKPTASAAGSLDPAPPAKVAASAAQALATTPGIHYTLKASVDYGNPVIGHLDSSGDIDFDHHRFSGIADGEGGPMLLFGGPSSGAVIVADGLYVRSGADAWEHAADPKSPLDNLTDPAMLSDALARWVAASKVDPTIRTAPCGTQRCQIVRLAVPKAALAGLLAYVTGQETTTLPDDLAPMSVDLAIDASGFPVRMETKVTAGDTTTTVTLVLTRLDPAPTITAPMP